MKLAIAIAAVMFSCVVNADVSEYPEGNPVVALRNGCEAAVEHAVQSVTTWRDRGHALEQVLQGTKAAADEQGYPAEAMQALIKAVFAADQAAIASAREAETDVCVEHNKSMY